MTPNEFMNYPCNGWNCNSHLLKASFFQKVQFVFQISHSPKKNQRSEEDQKKLHDFPNIALAGLESAIVVKRHLENNYYNFNRCEDNSWIRWVSWTSISALCNWLYAVVSGRWDFKYLWRKLMKFCWAFSTRAESFKCKPSVLCSKIRFIKIMVHLSFWNLVFLVVLIQL